MTKRNKAALYLRLSKEDKDKLTKGDDSASIQNQRLLLTDYALQHDYQIADIYSDDDESGLFDTRPDFERMLTDAKLGKFNIVIAKSQSRFSRNMEHVEKYLHRDFPNLGIRFIGVTDGADTFNRGNKKSRQINGLVNEWYCEDLSQNIRSAFRAKMKAGQYLGASCPYGYVKDPGDHNHLIIDEYAAGVVRRIYQLYLKGYGKAKIGRILTEEGIPIPSVYKRESLGMNYYNPREKEGTKGWSYQTIHTILNNEVYIGTVVQNKSNNLSYKDKKHIKQPEEKWIRAAGMHEPVIDPDTFRRVQERQKTRTKEVKGDSTASVFTGVIFCADCKHAMVRMYERRGEHKFTGYCCRTYKTQGKKQCSRHAVNDRQLQEAVLCSIQEEAGKILTPEDIHYLSRIQYICDTERNYKSQITHLEKEIERREGYKKKTYQSYLDDVISKEEYVSYAKEYETDIDSLKEKLEHLKEQQDEESRRGSGCDEWVERFKDYINVEKLTREMVLELIKRIEVNEDASVSIFYKFRNSYAGN
ncbi:MAG: recombinase family protein [Dorea sp.]|nr:recombinase family protein [Dorea sp.]